MIRAHNEHDQRQSRERSQDPSPRDASPTWSEAEHAQHGDVAIKAEFNANAFVQSFERATMGIAQLLLDARDAIIATVTDRYVKNVQQFQAHLQEQGLADHPSITATDINRHALQFSR